MRQIHVTQSLLTATVLMGLAAPRAVAAPPMPVEQVVMYYIEDDDHTLYRYTFDTNTVTTVGVLRDQFGKIMEDNEAMAYIPSGPNKGFYTSCNSTAPANKKERLIKINAVDAACTLYPDPVIGYIRGSAPFKDASGNWMIYGAQSKGGGTECRLVVINPVDGHLVGPLTPIKNSLGAWVVCEGLALDAVGELYGVEHLSAGAAKTSQLWHINRTTGLATTVGPRTPWKRIEALDFAFGDATPDITGLPAPADTWDASKGVLIGFSDNDNACLIMNATTGATVKFATINGLPIAFTTRDVECLAFLTAGHDSAGNLVHGYD